MVFWFPAGSVGIKANHLTKMFSNEQQFWESVLKSNFSLVSSKVLQAQKSQEMFWRKCNQINLSRISLLVEDKNFVSSLGQTHVTWSWKMWLEGCYDSILSLVVQLGQMRCHFQREQEENWRYMVYFIQERIKHLLFPPDTKHAHRALMAYQYLC